jgi:colanic acid/amylovoran biosynthesis glycosyltransferase
MVDQPHGPESGSGAGPSVGPAGVASGGFTVGYVIGTYPSLTTTFIDREVRRLRAIGVGIEIVAMRRSTTPLSDEQVPLGSSVHYVLPVDPARQLRAHLRFAVSARYWGTLARLVTWPHPTIRARVRTLVHFAQGVEVAHVFAGRPPARVHAHFVDRAAIVALVAARLLRVPYSATAHANDIYVNPVLLREKVASADLLVTCTEANAEHLRSELGADAARVVRLYHGIELDHYRPSSWERTGEPIVVAVGQLKEKKGFAHLIEACALLRERGLTFRCIVIGDGPLRSELEAQIADRGLGDRVRLLGWSTHDEVIDWYRRAAVFALPSVISGDGDRDGIPNVVLEAMAMELPVVATEVSGLPEAVEPGRTGVLVPPGDVEALAEGLADLLNDRAERERLGSAARERVTQLFSVERNVDLLARAFEEATRAR